MKMNKEKAKEIRSILSKELTPILEKYGLEFKLGGSQYDDMYNFVKYPKFTITPIGQRSMIEQDLDYHLSLLNDTKRELDRNKVCDLNGSKYKLFGYKYSSPKFPYICVNVDTNEQYKFTRKAVQEMFAVNS